MRNTDLPGDGDKNVRHGAYEPSVNLWARTPEIDVGQYESVRIQYRRWLGGLMGGGYLPSYCDLKLFEKDGCPPMGRVDLTVHHVHVKR